MFLRFEIILFLFLFLSANIYSQKTESKEENIVIEQSINTFTYKVKNNKVVIEETKDVTYSCDLYKSSTQIVEFYNSWITIDNIKIKSSGGKTSPQHRSYFKENILDTDKKVCFFNLYFKNKGETARVSIKKTYLTPIFFPCIHFTENYFCKNKTVRIVIPRWMNTELVPYNIEGIEEKKEYDRSSDSDIYIYTANNLEKWEKEKNAPGFDYTHPHLMVINRSSEYKGNQVTYFNSTDDLYKWASGFAKNQVIDKELIQNLADSITKNCESNTCKIETILQWVQNNIRYLADEKDLGGYRPQSPQEVIKKKYGDCKGMSNLTKHLLKALDFDARLAWIGTNELPYDFSLPNINTADHMICALFYEDELFFLDATVKYLSFNEYSEHIQKKQAMIENGDDNYLLVYVPDKSYKQNTWLEKTELTVNDNSLQGFSSITLKGESKNRILYNIHYTPKNYLQDDLLDYLKKRDSNYFISGLKLETPDINNKELQIRYNVNNKSSINTYDDIYYINIDFRRELIDNSIDTAKRKTDYVFPDKRHIIQETKLFIPENYNIEHLPDSLFIEKENYSYKIQFTLEENVVLYYKELIIKDIKIEKKNFAEWNSDLEKLKNTYQKQIILKRKTI